MFTCTVCDDDVPPGRLALGYTTCLLCGAVEAASGRRRRAAMCISQGHKQGLTYVSDPLRAIHMETKVNRDFMA